MIPEQEKKWREEYRLLGFMDGDEIYLAARKAAQVEIDKLESQSEERRVDAEDLDLRLGMCQNKLKDRDQEIERLKNRVKELGFNNDYVEEVEDKNWSVGEQLKERDELIKEAIPLIESKIYTITNEEWLEKARKMVGEG